MTEKNKPQARYVDLELMNTLTDGCSVCQKPFNLGDQVVPACGDWDGVRYIHIDEAQFIKQRNEYVDKRC